MMITDLSAAPRSIMFLATFNQKERALLEQRAELWAVIKEASPTRWAEILEAWRDAERARLAKHQLAADDDDGMRRQALHDLRAVTMEFASLTDGRRQKLYSLACRVARYVVHKKLSENEFRSALIDAARANGALEKHGIAWAVTTIRSAIVRATNDPLPPLARVFRSQGGA